MWIIKQMSKASLNTIRAYIKGYRVIDGEVFYKGERLKSCPDREGYCRFSFRDPDGRRATVKVHRLVAYQKFKAGILNTALQVRHLDSNKENNKDKNIELGTPRENSMDKPAEVRMRAALAATSYIKKHNHDQILSLHDSGFSYKQIMKKLEIKSKGTISFIINKSAASKTTWYF